MRRATFAIFVSVVLTIHLAANWYIADHLAGALPHAWRALAYVFVALFAAAFIVARFVLRRWVNPVTLAVDRAGSLWLAVMLYGVLAAVACDIVRAVDHIVPFLPAPLFTHAGKMSATAVVSAIVLVVIIAGYRNASRPRTRTVEVRVRRAGAERRTWTIAMASDIHLGSIIHRARFQRIVDALMAIKADVILLPGDVFDEDIGAVLRENQGELLRTLHAPHGVYAITGNHEYIGGADAACTYMEAHGVRVLRDHVIEIAPGLTVIGRDDRSSAQFGGARRKSLAELMQAVDPSTVTILMDHQPAHLEEAEHAGIDLQLSGHTHHGQLWPLNYITTRVYEKSWGYHRRGDTHYYISCGAGTWGPPVRTGNVPEVVRIELKIED